MKTGESQQAEKRAVGSNAGAAAAAAPAPGSSVLSAPAMPIHVPSINIPGPRKLIRPPMEKVHAVRRRDFPLSSAAAHMTPAASPAPPGDAHAETFYLQKQVQMQTSMVIILEDGERIEGIIEWYDRNAIKVRHGARTLIYKSCIKYLYKSSEGRFI